MFESLNPTPVHPAPIPKATPRLLKPLANERGVALLLALAMLAIMTVIGVFALDTSTTEVQISGNYRTSQEAFFAADRAMMFGLGNANFLFDPTDSTKNTRNMVNLTSNEKTANYIVSAGTGNSSLKSGSIECIYTGPDLADGNSSDTKVAYYLINAVVGGPNGSEARVEAQSKYQFPNLAEFEVN
jgi:PilX N-terminal